MVNKYQNLTPEGSKDVLFLESFELENLKNKTCELFKNNNFSLISTPTIEFLDVFNRESCGIALERMFKFTDDKGRLLVLRPDNTMPIARAVATSLNSIELPIKLYYSQKVFIKKPTLSGGLNEELQCGIELIGSSSLESDVEVLSIALQSLINSGIKEFKIEIGDAGYFKALLSKLPFDDFDKEKIREIIETKNYSALSSMLSAITDSEIKTFLNELPRMFGGEEIIDRAVSVVKFDDEALKSLKNLKEVFSKLKLKGNADKISVDLSLVHGINYYTGIVFRGYAMGGLKILSGGRYDSLIKEFGRDLPAVGFGLEMNAIVELLLREESL